LEKSTKFKHFDKYIDIYLDTIYYCYIKYFARYLEAVEAK